MSFLGAIIVSTPQKVALADAVKGIDMFKKVQRNTFIYLILVRFFVDPCVIYD